VNRLRQWPRRLLTALLACQLLVGAPVQAQQVASVAHGAAPVAAQALPAHCAGHALQQAAHAQQAAATTGAGRHHKGCCGQSDCAQSDCVIGSCGCHCAAAPALTASGLHGPALVLAGPARLDLAEPRIDRRAFEFFRPPI
jgi:hypothetical protein